MYNLLTRLFPICRSITGDGVRETLNILREYIPINFVEVPSGTQVFDWTVPDEWNIYDAYILDPNGRKIVDFKENNLHVLGHSEPMDARFDLNELKKHIYTLPDLPDAIPYRTSYYERRWGFCMPHNDFMQLKEGTYTVMIDSSFNKQGSLTLGECILEGEQSQEVLLSTYTCHPSLANDNISSVVIFVFLSKILSEIHHRYTYRFIFAPETIGAISYLSLNKDHLLSHVAAGLVGSMLGISQCLHYKRSRRCNAEIDRVTEHLMTHSLKDYRLHDFSPLGSDERQFCSPGFNLPVGLLSRMNVSDISSADFFQYHTSLDNLSLVSSKNLSETLNLSYSILSALEMNRVYMNQLMFCEPQLSKRNLFPSLGSGRKNSEETEKILWILNYSDGEHDLLEIADKLSVPIWELAEPARRLVKAGLIEPILRKRDVSKQ